MDGFDRLMKDRDRLLLATGILRREKAFIGPEVLHIDLTNKCNFNCIACWCRSPLLGDKSMPEWEKKLSLSLDVVKGIFDDLGRMGGLRQVKIVGGGEPFMHPDILQVIRYIKEKDKNIEIDINTNFSLVDEGIAKCLFELGLDSLTISLWAGTPATYARVHPNQTQATFYKIKDALVRIDNMKKAAGRPRPRVTFHNVIFNLNYMDMRDMIDFALEVNADNIQFVPVDTVKGKTETLLLDSGQRSELLDSLRGIRKNYASGDCLYKNNAGNEITLSDFDSFVNRVERINMSTGAYDEDVVEQYPCYAGWLFARVMATGDVVPCCKGHRMPMGNVHKNSFRNIWFSADYNEFRRNGLNLSKGHPYFSKMGNEADARTGCYNCDNLWQNIPMHRFLEKFKTSPVLLKAGEALLKFAGEK